MNSRVTAKERALIKGALSRVFSRSDLRKSILEQAIIPGYYDSKRPRVTKWATCKKCEKLTPAYLIDIDHIEPKIPLTITTKDFLAKVTANELVDVIWCVPSNLQALCQECHSIKSAEENRARPKTKRIKKDVASGKSNQRTKKATPINSERHSARDSKRRSAARVGKSDSKAGA